MNYIDELFIRLKKMGIECYVGNLFCRSFGYANDVIILAPTRYALEVLLRECLVFAKKYSLTFNAGKSKYLVFGKDIVEDNHNIHFDGLALNNVLREVHLGNIIGNSIDKERITKAISDFYRRYNVLQASFKYTNVSVKYKLFKTYCKPLYGCQLWDLSSKDCQLFYTAWRKCIRGLFGISGRTHNHLLHYICKDLPVDGQMHKRFLRFIHGALRSSNACTARCAHLAMGGSCSSVSKSLTFITHKYNLARYNIASLSWQKLSKHVLFEDNDSHQAIAAAILDFISLRDDNVISMEDKEGVQDILVNLCTS